MIIQCNNYYSQSSVINMITSNDDGGGRENVAKNKFAIFQTLKFIAFN